MQIIYSNVLTSGAFFPLLAYGHSFGLLFLFVFIHIKLKNFLLKRVLIFFRSLYSGPILVSFGSILVSSLRLEVVWLHLLESLLGQSVSCHRKNVPMAFLVLLGFTGFLLLGGARGVFSRGYPVAGHLLQELGLNVFSHILTLIF
jgi:hypothetical protein